MSNVTLRIGRTERRPHGIASLSLHDDDDGRICELDVQYDLLTPLRNRNPIAVDLLLLAASVYALDKSVSRDRADDAWTRPFALTLPVSDVARWERAHSSLTASLEFLTGDQWSLDFAAQAGPVLRGGRTRRRLIPIRGQTVCLFSGGLDSLVGAIDLLEQDAAPIVLVGHHDGDMAGPFSDQKALLQRLRAAYPNRISDVLVRVGQVGGGEDVTLRGRSLLFLSLGVFAASALGPAVPVVIPENGTIAINVPLTPSRRGSCSTRTAHPEYLRCLSAAVGRLGFANAIVNPLGLRTKGEAVAGCRNQRLLRDLVSLSVSCAKRSHKREWVRRTARSCGRCMPCIYRRAALHTIGMDSEIYGLDVCADEVAVDANDEGGSDFRACLSFLRQNLSQQQLATALLVNGPVPISEVTTYAGVVARAMDEVRQLLRDKASETIRRVAGIRR